MANILNASELAVLAAFDTPTVCNTLEFLAPERRGIGYTTEQLFCARPGRNPIVGYARTMTLRATHPQGGDVEANKQRKLDYYRYIDEGGPKPSVVVVQDLDIHPGYGAFWGEVNTNIHKGLGALGVVTNGSVRDIPQCAPDFQMLAGKVGPSHAWVEIEDFDLAVTVAGMAVRPGDLIHADMHGAVVIPHHVARQIAQTAATIAKRESILIGAARASGFSHEMLRDAILKSADIH